MIHAHVQQEDMVHTDTFHLLPLDWTSLGTISYSDRHKKTILLEIIKKEKEKDVSYRIATDACTKQDAFNI